MFSSYIKTAIRNLVRHGRHTLLNITGLAVALAACMIVFLVIQYETSYDKHIKGYKQIYQVNVKSVNGDGEEFQSGLPFPAIDYLRKDFSSFPFAQLMTNYGTQVTALKADGSADPDKKFREESGVFYAEPELAKMFELNFVQGSADVLKDVFSVVLSERMASKYFGDPATAMGKRIRFGNEASSFQVAGVFRDMPANTDFPFQIVASYEGFRATNKDNNDWPLDEWGANTSNHQVFVKLPETADEKTFAAQISTFEKKYNKENPNSTRFYLLHPLANVHFDDRFSNNGDHITPKKSLYSLGFIGLLILLMAIINYVNLSTALAVTRGKEVGVRKVMGGSSAQLKTQVFVETTLVVLVSVLIALGLTVLALPFVKEFMVVQERLTILNSGALLFLLLVTVVTILLSGFYPALVMGRFNPVEAIKNKINTSRVGSVSLRRVLVVLQFAFSQIFIVATIIAISQMRYIQRMDLGFNKESVLLISMNGDSLVQSRMETFRDVLRSRADVKELSYSFDPPSSDNSWSSNFAFDKMDDRDFNTNLKFADADYARTYQLRMVAGKWYGPSDTIREFVINETLARKCGFTNPGEAVGKMLRLGGGTPRPVVGVVADFKVASLRDELPPMVMAPRKRFYGVLGVRLNSQNLGRSRDEIKTTWDKIFPEYVYNTAFFDENIRNFYRQEERLSKMYKTYAILAILISCLGLYGLISFIVVQKMKEVGIRKVLGARLGDILFMFSKEFTILVLIAFVIAAPAAWYMMQKWLQDFEYRITPGVGVFAAAMLISVIVAWITVGYKALMAARVSPVKSLRSE
jgi:ABC-type antimicrobial peptide transport system permease subunit